MSKYDDFFNFVEEVLDDIPAEFPEADKLRKALNELRAFHSQDVEKPLFTEIGLKVLEYLQSTGGVRAKAKDIAQGMDTTSRQVSGAIRKLVTDGFVDKCGQNPVIYSLTEKGKNFDIKTYIKENNSNEKED